VRAGLFLSLPSARRRHKICEKLTGACTYVDRTVPQGEGEFEYFEQVQLINLCPMEAEEAKALIPRSVPPHSLFAGIDSPVPS
jgi:hypothetical protein